MNSYLDEEHTLFSYTSGSRKISNLGIRVRQNYPRIRSSCQQKGLIKPGDINRKAHIRSRSNNQTAFKNHQLQATNGKEESPLNLSTTKRNQTTNAYRLCKDSERSARQIYQIPTLRSDLNVDEYFAQIENALTKRMKEIN